MDIRVKGQSDASDACISNSIGFAGLLQVFSKMSTQKRTALSLKRRAEILKAVELSPLSTRRDLATRFKSAQSTLCKIFKNKQKIPHLADEKSSFSIECKHQRMCTLDDVDSALLQWFEGARAQNLPVAGPIMKEKAESLARQLGHTEFKCSDG